MYAVEVGEDVEVGDVDEVEVGDVDVEEEGQIRLTTHLFLPIIAVVAVLQVWTVVYHL